MMAYSLGRNIALLQTSLYSFKHPSRLTSKRIKQKKLATYYNISGCKVIQICLSFKSEILTGIGVACFEKIGRLNS